MKEKDELQELISRLPKEEIPSLIDYTKTLLNKSKFVSNSEFENAFDETIRNYDKAFKGLVERWQNI